jgi:hypothetical protein
LDFGTSELGPGSSAREIMSLEPSTTSNDNRVQTLCTKKTMKMMLTARNSHTLFRGMVAGSMWCDLFGGERGAALAESNVARTLKIGGHGGRPIITTPCVVTFEYFVVYETLRCWRGEMFGEDAAYSPAWTCGKGSWYGMEREKKN